MADDELVGWGRSWRFGVAVGFLAAGIVGLALIVSALIVRARSGQTAPGRRAMWNKPFFAGLAGVGIVWWLVRGIGTLIADFDASFKIVHTVLALVTIGLGLWVIRGLRPDWSGRAVSPGKILS